MLQEEGRRELSYNALTGVQAARVLRRELGLVGMFVPLPSGLHGQGYHWHRNMPHSKRLIKAACKVAENQETQDLPGREPVVLGSLKSALNFGQAWQRFAK